MGLSVFPYIDEIFKQRKSIVDQYDNALQSEDIQKLRLRENTKWNYCYYPVIFENESTLKRIKQALEAESIFPRRYFYPSLDQLPYIDNQSNCSVSRRVASCILCLPLFVGLEHKDVQLITNIILSNL